MQIELDALMGEKKVAVPGCEVEHFFLDQANI